jgi:hypothetical protein
MRANPASAIARLATREVAVAINGQKLHLFQMDWGIDKIARRNVNCGNKRLFGLTYH